MLYELRDVAKHYTRLHTRISALEDVDLAIEEGELIAVQGSTGSGKTTLLQMLGALDRPSSGSVVYDGKDLAAMRESRLCELRSHAFGFIFQAFNLIPTLTAQENVETALVPLHVGARERAERARSALADLGLADRAAHLPAELSGGEQQRVAIARALVRAPRVILADEPTGNLDEKTRDEIVSLLEDLWRERGQTIIIVTHDSQIAARASRLILLDEGRIVSSERIDAPQPLPTLIGSPDQKHALACQKPPCEAGQGRQSALSAAAQGPGADRALVSVSPQSPLRLSTWRVCTT